MWHPTVVCFVTVKSPHYGFDTTCTATGGKQRKAFQKGTNATCMYALASANMQSQLQDLYGILVKHMDQPAHTRPIFCTSAGFVNTSAQDMTSKEYRADLGVFHTYCEGNLLTPT